MLTRRPDRRPPATVMPGPPRLLALRDQPPEVPCRPRVAGGLSGRQQPLRRDPPRTGLHPRGHQFRDGVVVTGPRHPPRHHAGLVPGDHPHHGLVRRAADHSGAAVSAHLAVGRNNVHPFPRRLQWKLPGRCGDWLTPPPSPPGPQPPGRHDERGMGTFNWPPAGTSTRPHTGTFSRPRTEPGLYRTPADWRSESAQARDCAGQPARILQAGGPTAAKPAAKAIASYRHRTTGLEHRPSTRPLLDGSGQSAHCYGSEGWD